MGRAGIEVNGIGGTQRDLMLAMLQAEFAVQDIEEFIAGMQVRPRFLGLRKWYEFGEIGVHVAVGHHIAEAFEVVAGRFHAGLRKADTILAPVHPKNGMRLGFEKVREVFGEDHGNARQVTECGHNAAGFELR